jgi:hypothetical protein
MHGEIFVKHRETFAAAAAATTTTTAAAVNTAATQCV